MTKNILSPLMVRYGSFILFVEYSSGEWRICTTSLDGGIHQICEWDVEALVYRQHGCFPASTLLTLYNDKILSCNYKTTRPQLLLPRIKRVNRSEIVGTGSPADMQPGQMYSFGQLILCELPLVRWKLFHGSPVRAWYGAPSVSS